MPESKENTSLESQCIFYNSPFQWSDIIFYHNLKVLMIIGQTLTSLDGIRELTNLTELWVVESSLEQSQAIVQCVNLEKVYLYNNKLIAIPEIYLLRKLKVLWLSNNKINSIKNLSGSIELLEINLANNFITEIDQGFKNCIKLEELNLAGNPIDNLLTILDLRTERSLKKLQFYDPQYEASPIIKCVNYRSFIIHTLTQLKSLDGFNIHPDEIELVTNYYNAKGLYFSHQYHNEFYLHLNKINFKKEEQDAMINDALEKQFNVMVLNKMSNKISFKNGIDKEINRLQKKIQTCNPENEVWFEEETNNFESKNQQLNLEQLYCGNLKFVDLSDNEEVMSLIQNIMQSYICSLTRSFLLDSIELDRVIQVIDRRKLFQVMSSMRKVFNKTLPFWKYKKLNMNFHILKNPVGVLDSSSWNFRIISNLKKSRVQKYMVTNSISVADSAWLNPINSYVKEIPDEKNSKRTLVLVYCSKTLNSMNVYNHIRPKAVVTSCNTCQLFKTENHDIVPVFIIDYHYKYKDFLTTKVISKKNDEEEMITDNIFENINTITPDQEFDLPSNTIEVNNWSNLTCLNLSRTYLSTLDNVTVTLPNVIDLNLSYNIFENLNDVRTIFPNLITLNASFNWIKSVKVLTCWEHLQEFDISSNKVINFAETLNYLSGVSESLITLNIHFNPFIDIQNVNHMPIAAKRCFRNLKIFNEKPLTEEEISKDNFNLNSLKKLKVYKLVDEIFERKTDLLWNRDTCVQFEQIDVNRLEANYLGNHITVDQNDNPLCIFINKCCSKYKSLLIELDTKKLRYLTISQTFVNTVETLPSVSSLEELDLSFNMITVLNSTIINAENLVRLNLMGNYLTSLTFLKEVQLPCLKYFNVSKNFLHSLDGVEKLKTLEQFYAIKNFIRDWNDLRFLKDWQNLKALDVRGNLIENEKTLRRFLLFHLEDLKYMNGEAVTEEDINDAYTELGGILDTDYLLKEYSSDALNALGELSITNSSLRQVLLPVLMNLTSVNLEHNNLTCFSCLTHLDNLKYLCLSNNQITTFGDQLDMPKEVPWFKNLEVLYLNMNNITNLEQLELSRAPNLTSLYLHDNELSNIQGLNKLNNLKHLVLDRNKITVVNSTDVSDLSNLKNLYIEYNLINNLKFLKELKSLTCLFIAHNKLSKYETLQNLNHVIAIKELTISGNPLCRFNCHFTTVFTILPKLNRLDGILLDRSRLHFMN